MAPNIKDQLPILNRVLQFFKRNGLVIDSPLFRLHHQMSTFIIMIGFIFISVENYLDTKAILCHSGAQFSAYAKSYCWIHGTAYVRTQLQGKATGCFVDQSRLSSEEDAPITAYYLWLPYLLSLLFAFAKLPHQMWKKFFENNLIGHIMGGPTTNPNENGGGGFNQQNQTPGMGKNKNKFKSRPAQIAQNFLDFRNNNKYDHYHKKFALWEAMNILTVFLSMLVTHWILNYKFLNYGVLVVQYISSYGQHPQDGSGLHDPMCELFPTEVACNINIGSTTGAMDRTNFLCILGNNLFNQKYFFVLWLWWVVLLVISILGLFYRWGRIMVPSFSRYLLKRKIHGNQLQSLNLTSSDCFVLEMIVDNMTQSPTDIDEVFNELNEKVKHKFGGAATPNDKSFMSPSAIQRYEQSNHLRKIAEDEDGYKGDTLPLNRTNYEPGGFKITEENFSLYPTAPTDV